MTPKQVVQDAFEGSVTPWLESLGFTYSRSQFRYRRRVGEFDQCISVSLSQRNSIDRISFWSAFGVRSGVYNRWLKSQRREPSKNVIAGCNDWNIPGWISEEDQPMHFDFGDPARRPLVLNEWRRRCETVGIPYLIRLSSWEGAADELLRSNWQYESAADYLLIAGLPDRAIDVLEEEVARLDAQEFTWTENCHPTLIAKKRLQAEVRDSQRSVLQERIRQLTNS